MSNQRNYTNADDFILASGYEYIDSAEFTFSEPDSPIDDEIGESFVDVEIGKLANFMEQHNYIKHLSITNSKLEDRHILRLQRGIRNNQDLHTLEFDDNKIGPEGADTLAGIARSNTKLTTLSLVNNNIDDYGATKLAEALNNGAGITTLFVSHNNITDAGAAQFALAIANNKLNTFAIEGNFLTANKGVKGIFNSLKDNTSLEDLEIGGYDFSDSKPSPLAGQSVLIALSLAMRKNRTLTSLDLAQSDIHPVLLPLLTVAIKHNPNLTTVNICDVNSDADIGSSLAKKTDANFVQIQRLLEQRRIAQNRVKN